MQEKSKKVNLSFLSLILMQILHSYISEALHQTYLFYQHTQLFCTITTGKIDGHMSINIMELRQK